MSDVRNQGSATAQLPTMSSALSSRLDDKALCRLNADGDELAALQAARSPFGTGHGQRNDNPQHDGD